MIESNEYDDVEIFLTGTFHQDVEDPKEALLEYIEEVDSLWLLHISKEIERFLMSELSERYKQEFIQEYTDIYYPAIGLKPVEWLMDVLEEIKKSINFKN